MPVEEKKNVCVEVPCQSKLDDADVPDERIARVLPTSHFSISIMPPLAPKLEQVGLELLERCAGLGTCEVVQINPEDKQLAAQSERVVDELQACFKIAVDLVHSVTHAVAKFSRTYPCTNRCNQSVFGFAAEPARDRVLAPAAELCMTCLTHLTAGVEENMKALAVAVLCGERGLIEIVQQSKPGLAESADDRGLIDRASGPRDHMPGRDIIFLNELDELFNQCAFAEVFADDPMWFRAAANMTIWEAARDVHCVEVERSPPLKVIEHAFGIA